MNTTMFDALSLEHQLRVKKADLVGPHHFERELQCHRQGRRLAIRARVGGALVAIGTRLQGTPLVAPARAQG
jgi:hypothetical protein